MPPRETHPSRSGDAATEEPSMERAASATAEALTQLERLASSLARAPLHSAKQIEHAIERTREAARVQQSFVLELQALIEAVSLARDRQAAAADAINEAVKTIEVRAQKFNALQARFASIGEAARGLNGLVQAFQAQRKQAGTEALPSELVEQLGVIETGMETVIEEARRLTEEGRAEGLHDFARDADSLRQQIQSARHRIQAFRGAMTN